MVVESFILLPAHPSMSTLTRIRMALSSLTLTPMENSTPPRTAGGTIRLKFSAAMARDASLRRANTFPQAVVHTNDSALPTSTMTAIPTSSLPISTTIPYLSCLAMAGELCRMLPFHRSLLAANPGRLPSMTSMATATLISSSFLINEISAVPLRMPSPSCSVTTMAASILCAAHRFLWETAAVPTAWPPATLLETERRRSLSPARRAGRCSFTTWMRRENLHPQPYPLLVAGDPLLSRALQPIRGAQSSLPMLTLVRSRFTSRTNEPLLCSQADFLLASEVSPPRCARIADRIEFDER